MDELIFENRFTFYNFILREEVKISRNDQAKINDPMLENKLLSNRISDVSNQMQYYKNQNKQLTIILQQRNQFLKDVLIRFDRLRMRLSTEAVIYSSGHQSDLSEFGHSILTRCLSNLSDSCYNSVSDSFQLKESEGERGDNLSINASVDSIVEDCPLNSFNTLVSSSPLMTKQNSIYEVKSAGNQICILLTEQQSLSTQLAVMHSILAAVKSECDSICGNFENEIKNFTLNDFSDAINDAEINVHTPEPSTPLRTQLEKLKTNLLIAKQKCASTESELHVCKDLLKIRSLEWNDAKLRQTAKPCSDFKQAGFVGEKTSNHEHTDIKHQIEELQRLLMLSGDNIERLQIDLEETNIRLITKSDEFAALITENKAQRAKIDSLNEKAVKFKVAMKSCCSQYERRMELCKQQLEEIKQEFVISNNKYEELLSAKDDQISTIQANFVKVKSELKTQRDRSSIQTEEIKNLKQQLHDKDDLSQSEVSLSQIKHVQKLKQLSEQRDKVIRLLQQRLRETKQFLVSQHLHRTHIVGKESIYYLNNNNTDDLYLTESSGLDRLNLSKSPSLSQLTAESHTVMTNSSCSRQIDKMTMSRSDKRRDKHLVEEHLPTNYFCNDPIGLQYMRHVFLKFLSSCEKEATELVCILSNLFCLNEDEENLLLNSIKYRRRWPKSSNLNKTKLSGITKNNE